MRKIAVLFAVALATLVGSSAFGQPYSNQTQDMGKVAEQLRAQNVTADNVMQKAFQGATANTGEFLSKMWNQYGPKLGADAAWRTYLAKAIESAKAGDWSATQQNCELCLANNQNALDAKLLRAVALQKLAQQINQQPKQLWDTKTLMGTRQRAQEFLYGKSTSNPVADSVTQQMGQ